MYEKNAGTWDTHKTQPNLIQCYEKFLSLNRIFFVGCKFVEYKKKQ